MEQPSLRPDIRLATRNAARRAGLRHLFPLSAGDTLLTVAILACAAFACILLSSLGNSDSYALLLFNLAVFLISRFTSGYLYGVVSALISVLACNYAFTYPYYSLNFSLSGYPLTALCMLTVALATSALTTQSKRHSQIELEAEKEKTRSNLLRAISHDLRTPLTSILGASSAIIENDGAITARERLKLLGEIQSDAQWLIRMVENLLSITRFDSDAGARIIKAPEAAEEVAAEAVTKFNKRFPEMPVKVSVPDELLLAPMDATLIEQVLINLLENVALHAHGATHAELSTAREGGEALFTVTDDGAGIPRDALPHIFDGYFHEGFEADGDAKRNMGIGLSVCSTIVRAHGGGLTARNREDGQSGAVFRFTLPLEERT